MARGHRVCWPSCCSTGRGRARGRPRRPGAAGGPGPVGLGPGPDRGRPSRPVGGMGTGPSRAVPVASGHRRLPRFGAHGETDRLGAGRLAVRAVVRVTGSPVVELNRAVAVAMATGQRLGCPWWSAWPAWVPWKAITCWPPPEPTCYGASAASPRRLRRTGTPLPLSARGRSGASFGPGSPRCRRIFRCERYVHRGTYTHV